MSRDVALIPSGIAPFDERVGGLEPGGTYLVVGAPGPEKMVAALQFDSPNSVDWGSLHLKDAVIDYVAQLGRGLDVFEGFSRSQMMRRATIFGISVVVLGALAAWQPDYATAFFNRLLLGWAKTHV